MTNLPPSCADCLEIWEPQPPGTLTACPVMGFNYTTKQLLFINKWRNCHHRQQIIQSGIIMELLITLYLWVLVKLRNSDFTHCGRFHPSQRRTGLVKSGPNTSSIPGMTHITVSSGNSTEQSPSTETNSKYCLHQCATIRTVSRSTPRGVTGDFFRSYRHNHVPWGRHSL